jgi:hypothetical protein
VHDWDLWDPHPSGFCGIQYSFLGSVTASVTDRSTCELRPAQRPRKQEITRVSGAKKLTKRYLKNTYTRSHRANRCMLGCCDKCGVDKLPTHPREEQTDEHAFRITYQYYDKITVETSYEDENGKRKTTERLQLVKKTAPIGEFMQFYRKQLKYFTFHCLMSQYTTKIRKERAALELGDISLIMDYSEKLNKLRRTQVQSEHWGNVAMTLEVAVAEGFRPGLDDTTLSALMAAVNASPIETRGDLLTQGDMLEKRIYYHCSDYKPQEARVTTHNMEVMLRELLAAGILKSGKTVYLKTDGCAKQYKCAEAMYLMCKLADSLGVVIDQMLEVTGHGKDEADVGTAASSSSG